MLGSIPNASPWHGVWHWLMEDTTPARGALASANATRMAAPTVHDPPLAIPPQTAQNTLKDLETKNIQREAPPTKPMVDKVFDFTLARQALEKLIDTTPSVAYTITAEPQGRKHPKTAADAFTRDTVFAITDVIEPDISISASLKDSDFPFEDLEDIRAFEACPDILDPKFPAWSDKAAIELYYMDKLLEEGYDNYTIKPGDEDYVDPDFPFMDMAEMRFLAENVEWDDDEHINELIAHYRNNVAY